MLLNKVVKLIIYHTPIYGSMLMYKLNRFRDYQIAVNRI